MPRVRSGDLASPGVLLRSQTGSATVEHAALSLLVAVMLAGVVGAVAASDGEGGRELGFAVARKLRCAAVGPGPCWRDPLTEAYGRSLAGAVRALAPLPVALGAAGGTPLVPVDFRVCRSASCATPGSRFGLTASNRRVTVFVAVAADVSGGASITYWEYRPGLGWVEAVIDVSAERLAELAATPLLEADVPALVALETLAGANHFDFEAGEEPPWRWQVERR